LEKRNKIYQDEKKVRVLTKRKCAPRRLRARDISRNFQVQGILTAIIQHKKEKKKKKNHDEKNILIVCGLAFSCLVDTVAKDSSS